MRCSMLSLILLTLAGCAVEVADVGEAEAALREEQGSDYQCFEMVRGSSICFGGEIEFLSGDLHLFDCTKVKDGVDCAADPAASPAMPAEFFQAPSSLACPDSAFSCEEQASSGDTVCWCAPAGNGPQRGRKIKVTPTGILKP